MVEERSFVALACHGQAKGTLLRMTRCFCVRTLLGPYLAVSSRSEGSAFLRPTEPTLTRFLHTCYIE
jgi:hypothetical protein